jgi:hypothetical protein
VDSTRNIHKNSCSRTIPGNHRAVTWCSMHTIEHITQPYVVTPFTGVNCIWIVTFTSRILKLDGFPTVNATLRKINQL